MRVLSIGEDPATVDFSKTPDGVDEGYIRDGLAKAQAELEAKGWEVETLLVPPELDRAVEMLRRSLDACVPDVILFGGGLRMPPPRAELFEALLNTARRKAAGAAFAFDNDPNEGPAAVLRQAPRS